MRESWQCNWEVGELYDLESRFSGSFRYCSFRDSILEILLKRRKSFLSVELKYAPQTRSI
jgi:hypothetical protein